MSQSLETLDITLLRNNKNEFVIRCQDIIAISVKQYTIKGMFSAADFDDIKQSVTLELINRLPLIEKNYNGKTLLRTYVGVVIKNICLQIYKNESRTISSIPLGEITMLTVENNEGGVVIAQEQQRFATALKLYHSKRFKLLVCLKAYFLIPVRSIELQRTFHGITTEDIRRILDIFENQTPTKTEFEHFTILASMMNKYELASVTESSLRHWTNIELQKLIHVLNGDPPTRIHTKETVRLLLEHYSKLYTENE